MRRDEELEKRYVSWFVCVVELLTTKNVHFVKLSKCVTDFTIAFLSSRWSKNIYETSNLGVRMRELCLQENICLGYRYFQSETSWRENELPILPVRDQNFQWLAEEGTVWRENELPVLPVRDRNFWWLAEEDAVWHENKLPVLLVLNRYYRWSLTESTGRCFRILLSDLEPICF
jgi:hypothetical protein